MKTEDLNGEYQAYRKRCRGTWLTHPAWLWTRNFYTDLLKQAANDGASKTDISGV